MFGIHPADAVWSLIFPVLVLILIVAVAQVTRAMQLSLTAKIIWLAVIVLMPVFGALIWFAFGKGGHRSLSSEEGVPD